MRFTQQHIVNFVSPLLLLLFHFIEDSISLFKILLYIFFALMQNNFVCAYVVWLNDFCLLGISGLEAELPSQSLGNCHQIYSREQQQSAKKVSELRRDDGIK